MRRRFVGFIWCLATLASPGAYAENALDLFSPDNLFAWCIVPFDSIERDAEQRASMLKELGLRRMAYDYRKRHIPVWEAELKALRRHRIELVAWYLLSPVLDDEAKSILKLLDEYELSPQLWVSGTSRFKELSGEERLKREVERIRAFAIAAGKIGSQVGLYNHGGWFGEPENQIAIVERLATEGILNVGIVYNQHHGHEHVERFETILHDIKPYLIALNLNGMTHGGDKLGKKIQIIGEGDLDRRLLRFVLDSGWKGPVGILDHDRSVDSKTRLRDNRDGLLKLALELHEERAGK